MENTLFLPSVNELVQDKRYLLDCLKVAHMEEQLKERIPIILVEQLRRIQATDFVSN